VNKKEDSFDEEFIESLVRIFFDIRKTDEEDKSAIGEK
jgi:hypothetical protein